MNWFLIPLQDFPQTFQITLGGANYQLTVKWNDAADAGWQFDLDDSDTGVNIVAGVPMITGANCLAGLEYLGIAGLFVVQTNGNPDAVPTFTNLGTDSNLYYVTSAATAA